ncbi:uncharacterized protein LOC142984916 [Anticarsia gemmatalis]|uniref:uncharacterized protein LOC142984916 n=1 Tax=Anticarsia gemmatalis TaxID=129554 RepID=UPI003F75F87B
MSDAEPTPRGEEPSEDFEQHDPDSDMGMFASVWVKVEVEEQPDEENVQEMEVTRYSKRKKKNPQKIPKELKCEMCDYTTIYRNCLSLHVHARHSNYKPFNCEHCNYVTKYPTSLTRHMITQHECKGLEKEKNLPLYTCDQCTYTSYYKWNLNAHRRKHRLEKEFKCTECSYTTAYRHNFMKHSKVHNKKETFYKCDKCPFVTKYDGHITRHLAKIHNEVSDKANKCDLCDFSTKIRWRLNLHKQRSKQNDIIKCILCEFETYYMCESRKHKVTHYSEIYAPRNSDQNEGNDVNEENNDMDVPETTNQCSNEETEIIGQTVHEKNNHYIVDPVSEVDWHNIKVLASNNKEKPFQCIQCTYTARFKASVQRHFQRHHTGNTNRPYKCVNCDFSTKTKDQIALHNKRSKSEVVMYCRLCEYSTNFKCQYVMHQKCHYEHKCTACGYTCKNKYEITKHYSIVHLGNGLKCKYCDYKATRTDSLLLHEIVHTGKKPFNCEFCDYSSVRRSLLLNHTKRYHSHLSSDTVIINDSKIESLKMNRSEIEMLQTNENSATSS